MIFHVCRRASYSHTQKKELKTIQGVVIIAITLLLVAQVAFCEEPIDTGMTIRNTVMRAEPATASDVVTELSSNTPVVVFERQRLWVRVATADNQAIVGWLRFTELRFGTSVAVQSNVPKSGGFAGFSRSVSGFLNSFRGGGSHTAQTTSTIGIWGLTVADLQTAQPDAHALAAISRYTISAADAEQFAGAGGLSVQQVPLGGGR